MRILSLAAIAAATILWAAGSASAQQGTQAAANAPVYRPIIVVDIGYILNNHPTMKAEIGKIEAEMATADKEFATKRDKIMADMKALSEQFAEGTPDYVRQEKLIAQADTDFRLELVKKRKEFDEKRALVLAQVHAQLTHVVKYACDSWKSSVVLRVSREKLDPKKPQTIEMGMGQEVFYFNPEIDITDWAMRQLQPSTPAASESTSTATRQSAPGRGVQR